MPARYKSGDPVVVMGHGVGRLVSVDAERVVAQLREGQVVVRAADADGLLRPIVDRARAERFLERICERCTEERELPRLRSIRELTRAPLERQVEYTRWYFRRRKDLHHTELNILLATSENVVAELAMALGVEDAALRAAVKRGSAVKKGKPVVKRRTARALPPPPTVADAEFLRSFWLGAKARVGEWPEDDDDVLEIAVRPGAWHAYSYDNHGEDEDAVEGLLLLHAERAELAIATIDIDLGGVNLEGGTIGVLDAAALTDDEFGVDEVERLRRDGDGYGNRGVEVSTMGDGDHRVLVDDRDAATGVLLPF